MLIQSVGRFTTEFAEEKLELAQELPRSIHAELVDSGERFSFYDVLMKGSTTAFVTTESLSRTQLSVVADYLQRLTVAPQSIVANHRIQQLSTTLCDFEWGEERLTVSNAITLCP